MTHTAQVEYDEDGEAFIVFPQELIEELGWEPGDKLLWTDNKNGSYSLTKVEIDEDEGNV